MFDICLIYFDIFWYIFDIFWYIFAIFWYIFDIFLIYFWYMFDIFLIYVDIFWYNYPVAFGLPATVPRSLKITEKAVEKTPQIDKKQGLGWSWGALGGDLGAFWPPWTPKAGKVRKKLVRCPPLGIPRGNLKSNCLGFFLKKYITFCCNLSPSDFQLVFFDFRSSWNLKI